MSDSLDRAAVTVAALEAQGISKAEIAERAGISRSTLYRVLKRNSRNYYSDTIIRIEKLRRAYGLPMTRP